MMRRSVVTKFCLILFIPFANGFGIIEAAIHSKRIARPFSVTRVSSSAPTLWNIEDRIKYSYAQKKEAEYKKKISDCDAQIKTLEQIKTDYLKDPIEEGNVDVQFTESKRRSAFKAIMWRFIAGGVTLLTSLKVAGSLNIALKIVGSDFISKALTMFVGERLMNKSQSGRECGSDSTSRSVAKALIWRLFAICNTLVASLFIAGDLKLASKIAGGDAIVKTGLMVFYERLWAKVAWGKRYLPPTTEFE